MTEITRDALLSRIHARDARSLLREPCAQLVEAQAFEHHLQVGVEAGAVPQPREARRSGRIEHLRHVTKLYGRIPKASGKV